MGNSAPAKTPWFRASCHMKTLPLKLIAFLSQARLSTSNGSGGTYSCQNMINHVMHFVLIFYPYACDMFIIRIPMLIRSVSINTKWLVTHRLAKSRSKRLFKRPFTQLEWFYTASTWVYFNSLICDSSAPHFC